MKVSAKRQVTLPIQLCKLAKINEGDEVMSFVDRQGVISIVKKSPGAANGILQEIKADKRVSEKESLNSVLNT